MICDGMNDRIPVCRVTPDLKVEASLKVAGPEQVCVHPGILATDPRTGDCYFAGRTCPTVLRIDARTGEIRRLDTLASQLYAGQSGFHPDETPVPFSMPHTLSFPAEGLRAQAFHVPGR